MEATQGLVNFFSGKKVKQINILDGCRDDEFCAIHFEDGTVLYIEASSETGEPKLYIHLSSDEDKG